jgi:hypothetical protein
MDSNTSTIQLGATSSGANQGVPPPPPGFVPEAQPTVSGTSVTPPPPPAGFIPDPSQSQVHSDEIQINPSDNLLTEGAKAVGGTMEGIGEGVFGTLAGAGDLLGVHSQTLHSLAGDNNTTHGLPQSAGRSVEDLAEFFLGDEALKGLSLSDRLMKASKMAKMVEESPLLNRALQAGVRAIRGGAVGTVQGAVKTENVPDALVAGATGAVGDSVVPEVFDAAKAAPGAISNAAQTLRNVIQPGAIQEAFQGQVRGIVNDAAKEYGVNTSAAQSIRDVAQEVSNSLQGKAKATYQSLDDLLGGRAQRFTDALKNVQQKIRELNGIDPDQEGAYVEKLNDLQDAHDKAMDEADAALKAQGKSSTARGLLDQANSDFRKSKAMLDVNRAIRSSSEGLRPELASGTAKAIPEHVNTGKLFGRVNKLYDAGRLQDALGQQRSEDLLRAVNDSHVSSQTAQSWARLAKTGAKYAAYGALPFGGYEIVRHLLGE